MWLSTMCSDIQRNYSTCKVPILLELVATIFMPCQKDLAIIAKPTALRSHSFNAGDLVLYDWPKQGDHKLSPIFKGPFVIVRPVGAVCYGIKSRTLQNKFIKVVHVQHLRPYFKRDTDVMQNNTSDEENDSCAENQDPADHHVL
ncbi:uncharacterized protein TNCV_476071 [Trichonephila clavipes]|nr:uncharacterized protein TNCV_476071 [Trichonephila clavipes]